MKRFFTSTFLFFLFSLQAFSHTNPALSMSEILAYNARFNPADTRQAEILKDLKPSFLIENLKTDNEKIAFWVNVYNSFMLTYLRDTAFEGVYTNFYKIKNVPIAGKTFSLFDIEHEFIRMGKKNKGLGFKKSILKKDTTWQKLRPTIYNYKAILIMYRGLYGYPPFQVVENGDIETAFINCLRSYDTRDNFDVPYNSFYFDWFIIYKIGKDIKNPQSPLTVCLPTPFAVYINNFYPKYEGVKFKEEEKNPWLK